MSESITNISLIENFITVFKTQHSWYKHLGEDRDTPFIFFKKEDGNLDYFIENSFQFKSIDSIMKDYNLSIYDVNRGRMFLSRFIYGRFSEHHDYYHNNLSYSQLHSEILYDLKLHLMDYL